jgi:hypothetical protein
MKICKLRTKISITLGPGVIVTYTTLESTDKAQGRLLAFLAKVVGDKHTNLLHCGIECCCETFYRIGPREYSLMRGIA